MILKLISYVPCKIGVSISYRCNQHCNSEQLKIIQHMPEILTIKVKRLANGLHLQIPSTLDFRQFSSVVSEIQRYSSSGCNCGLY